MELAKTRAAAVTSVGGEVERTRGERCGGWEQQVKSSQSKRARELRGWCACWTAGAQSAGCRLELAAAASLPDWDVD